MENAPETFPEAYPAQLGFTGPLQVERWRVVGNPILAIPHLFIASALQGILDTLACVAFIMILFTGNIPRGLFNFMAMIFRYSWRVFSYALFMRENYPAFEFVPSEADPSADQATFSISYPQNLSRGLIFIKWLLVIPHLVVLAFVALAAAISIIIAWFAVLFTGAWPQGLRDFVIGTIRWIARVSAYFYLMTDVYPPFSTEP